MANTEKKIRRFSLLAEAYEIEMQEVLEEDKIYEAEFAKDFVEENQYASETQAGQESPPAFTNEEHHNPEKLDCLKQLHRALARKTHPDVSGSDEDFKKIQAAYEENDIVTLLLESRKNDVDVVLEAKDLTEIDRLLQKYRERIEEKKKTLRWHWCNSDKSSKTRVLVHEHLGIDTKLFELWKKQKASSVEQQ